MLYWPNSDSQTQQPGGSDSGSAISSPSPLAATFSPAAATPPLPLSFSQPLATRSADQTSTASSSTSALPFAPCHSAVAAPVASPPLVLVGYEPSGDEEEITIREFPRRPGKALCDFYVKTGHCRFADSCVFDHPEAYVVRLTGLGLPLRPDEPICTFYLKNNDCRFGPACKFHHPSLRPVYAGSALGVATVDSGKGGNDGERGSSSGGAAGAVPGQEGVWS